MIAVSCRNATSVTMAATWESRGLRQQVAAADLVQALDVVADEPA